MLQKLGFAPGFNKQVTETGAEGQWFLTLISAITLSEKHTAEMATDRKIALNIR